MTFMPQKIYYFLQNPQINIDVDDSLTNTGIKEFSCNIVNKLDMIERSAVSYLADFIYKIIQKWLWDL